MAEITATRLLEVLSRHIGARCGVSADQLAEECLSAQPGARDLRRLRRAVQELREDGHHICGTPSTGYYVAATADELNATCEFLYDRAMCSLKQISRMKGVSLPDLRGQLRLPT